MSHKAHHMLHTTFVNRLEDLMVLVRLLMSNIQPNLKKSREAAKAAAEANN